MILYREWSSSRRRFRTRSFAVGNERRHLSRGGARTAAAHPTGAGCGSSPCCCSRRRRCSGARARQSYARSQHRSQTPRARNREASVSPDAKRVQAFLARASKRLAWIAALEGATVGLAIALALAIAVALVFFVSRSTSSGATAFAALALGVLGISIGALVRFRRPRRVPLMVERRAPHCRNVVITAAELMAVPARVRPEIG